MAKTGTSPLRSRRASSKLPLALNHSLESAAGEEESFEVSSTSKRVKGNDGAARPAPPASKSPSLSPVPSSSPSPPPEESKPALPTLPELLKLPQPQPDPQPEVTKQTSTALDTCPVCYNVPEEQRKRNSTSAKEEWVACEQCEQWFHWQCIRDDLAKGIAAADLETWYCKTCIADSITDPARETLTVKLKESKRKSTRKKADVDYVAEDPPAPPQPPKPAGSRVNPWRAVAESRPLVKTHFRKMKPEQLTVQWLETDPKAFMEPIFIDHAEGLDMKVLPADIKISEIAELVGRDKPIDVIDVASQSGLHSWTLGRWADYYEDPNREKVRNVISLELSSSPIKDRVASPKFVRQIDWVEQHWPGDLKAQDIYPQVSKYCLMSPGESWTDWHIDFSASSVFYHILRGRKVFYFISPTPDNLRKYEIWSGSANQQSGVWLGDECDRVYKVELKPGNTLIIPSGWIHCVYTPSDALVIGGNFLHSYNIPLELRVYQIELNTKVPKRFRFPYFVSMCWYVGWHYHRLLETEKTKHTLKGTEVISRRVLQNLKSLAAFLVEQTYRIQPGAKGVSAERKRIANENIPWQLLDDPTQMARDFQKMIYIALEEEERLPKLAEDEIPKFNAADWIDAAPYDFLKDQYASMPTPAKAAAKTGAGSVNGSTKRKPSVASQSGSQVNGTAPKTAKFRHFNGAASQNRPVTNGVYNDSFSAAGSPAPLWSGNGQASTNHYERIERQSFEPVVSHTREKRERPPISISHTAYEFEHPNTPRRREEEVDVKTIVHENVVRKIVPGEEEGSWVVETRRVTTTTERMYFAPPRRPAVTAGSSSLGPLNGKMEVDESYTISAEPEAQPPNQQTNGLVSATADAVNVVAPGEPRDEIARMLGKVNGDDTSTAPSAAL